MPVLTSQYSAPWLFRNGHVSTIFPSLFRRPTVIANDRQRVETADDDFLVLDWYRRDAKRLVIISHGLEGNAQRPYVLGMVRQFGMDNWDCLAWNFRSCGGHMNRQKRFYHSGATEDLALVIETAAATGRYNEIALVGFSMGGNLTLLHAGREAKSLNPLVTAVAGVSVPCDLEACAYQLAQSENKIYMKRFLRDLKAKMEMKHQLYPEEIDVQDYHLIRDFKAFDDRYTAPLHGFKDAKDYWTRSSCIHYLSDIEVPALLVNAKNDPFLSEAAYPFEQAERSDNLFFEAPDHGGHVGFVSLGRKPYWIEQRVSEFINQYSAL